ncbi:MAG: hypothetical protein E7448_07830 [Ruminococcaceae bacterium]|nr:hypothetical protein [Oscillospiraceae bacterium]
MDEILEQLQALIPKDFDYQGFFIVLGVLSAFIFLLGLAGRFICGKKSVAHSSISSVIGILFIYALAIVIHSTGLKLGFMLSPLPFIGLDTDVLYFFSFTNVDYVVICGEVLNMVVLAFTVNVIDSWMPVGKRLFGWFFFRALSVALGTVAFTIIMALVHHFLPEGLLTWAPVILLGILLLSLALGALKLLVGALIATVNPLLAVLYTFFFASVLGKMVTKAILTTLVMSAMVYALNYFGIFSIFIGTGVLIAYIPLLVALLILWFIIGKVWMK